jgi:hypothetical protein
MGEDVGGCGRMWGVKREQVEGFFCFVLVKNEKNG